MPFCLPQALRRSAGRTFAGMFPLSAITIRAAENSQGPLPVIRATAVMPGVTGGSAAMRPLRTPVHSQPLQPEQPETRIPPAELQAVRLPAACLPVRLAADAVAASYSSIAG